MQKSVPSTLRRTSLLGLACHLLLSSKMRSAQQKHCHPHLTQYKDRHLNGTQCSVPCSPARDKIWRSQHLHTNRRQPANPLCSTHFVSIRYLPWSLHLTLPFMPGLKPGKGLTCSDMQKVVAPKLAYVRNPTFEQETVRSCYWSMISSRTS